MPAETYDSSPFEKPSLIFWGMHRQKTLCDKRKANKQRVVLRAVAPTNDKPHRGISEN
jgi:hypothetical protein